MTKNFDSLKFPKDFLWGAAASAPQTEGESISYGKTESTWDKWFQMAPEVFHNNIGPGRTSNVYNLYKEDIKRMQEINMNSYRTSISWTRLLPDGKTVNKEAVAFYRDYFEEMIKHNIKPIINLFHFDLPWWLMEKGGWTNYEIVEHFAYFARVCAEEFGDIVTDWVTFNEPIVHVEMSYIHGYHYPAILDLQKAVTSGYHTVLAHARAIEEMKQVNKDLHIGTILNITPVYGKSDAPEDVEAAHHANLLNVKSFLDPMVNGTYSQELIDLLKTHNLLPEYKKEDVEIIKNNTVEFLGINYYQPMRVQAKKEMVNFPAVSLDDIYAPYIWEERRINEHRGWEIYPEAIYDVAMMVKNEYGNIPWFVSENGMGVEGEEKFIKDGIVEDEYRIDFLKEHLSMLHKAIEDGSNCFGYHMWTFVDCWSWLNGYKNRYGFFRVNLEDQSRMPKRSAYWFRDFVEEQSK